MGRLLSRKNGHHGFTLAELIVATTVTVLVAGSTVAILRSSASARQRVDRQAALQQEARVAVNVIATTLRNASRAGDQVRLEGACDLLDEMPADRLRVFTISNKTIRPGQPESDVKECEFFVKEPEETDEPAVLMQRIDPTWNKEPDEGGVVQPLAWNVLALQFSYHDGLQWRDDWPARMKSWPLAVRIRLAIRDDAEPVKIWTTGRTVNFPHRPRQQEKEQAKQ